MDHESESISGGRGLDPHKRRAILEGAQSVFLRDGFASASMDEVARVAGVGKMTVYRHFGSKEALFQGMLREVCGGIMFDAQAPEGASLEEELTILGRGFVGLVTDPNRLATYRLAMAEAERSPDISRMFYEGAVLVVVAHVAARLRAHAPHLTMERSLEIAGTFLAMVQGHAMMRLMMGIDRDIDRPMFARQIAVASSFVAGAIAQA